MIEATVGIALGLVIAGVLSAPIDPPPVNEPALAGRLVEMTRPSRGERAIILYDPTYYPGIAIQLRDELHRRGVQTVLLVEDSVAMIQTYIDEPRPPLREREVVAMLMPLFESSDIFYWMPARGYVSDLRWEILVGKSRVRSVHFHWLLPLPGTRTGAEIVSASSALERRILDVDLAEHSRRQADLAGALAGRDVRITTPGGTDLAIRVPADQWFHRGDGDASKARAGRARSIRDREIELPVGMFNFVPNARGVTGTIVPSQVDQVDGEVRGATFRLRQGRVVDVTAEAGLDAVQKKVKRIGPDGDRIATVWLNTNPLSPERGVTIDVGSNWENGGRNRADRTYRIILRLPDARIEAGGRVLMENGRLP